MTDFVQTVVAGSIGAVVGSTMSGTIAYLTARANHRRQKRDSASLARKNEIALLEVLQGDLIALQRLHEQGSTILAQLPAEKPLLVFIPVTLNYFSVFENNVHELGRVSHRELRSRIIFTYQKAKSMIDSIRRNNDVLKEYQQWKIEFERTGAEIASKQMDDRLRYLTSYAATLKESSKEFLGEAKYCLEQIERELAR